MKKSTIWLLTIVMAVTFGALLYFQLIYLERMAGMRNEQFTENVMRSLSATSAYLEKQETMHFLERDMMELDAGSWSAETSVLPSAAPPPSMGGEKYMEARYSEMHEQLRNRYKYQKGLLNEVILSIMREADDRPIIERADSAMIKRNLTEELARNGLSVPFVFAVTDEGGRIVYESPGFADARQKDIYSQELFPDSNRRYMLKVAFPTKNSYIYESVSFILPTFVFTGILLIVFLYTIITAFRQKKLTTMKTDFINNMTHELKTPISTISLAGEMLGDPAMTKSPATLKHLADVITDESKRLRFQVEKVLQMSVLDTDSSRALKFKEVDANATVQSVVNTFKIKVEKFGGTIGCRLEARYSDVYVDEMQFTNVIFNLCDNAVKYRSEEVAPAIEISTRDVGDNIEIRVRDNGIGIRRDDLKRIFDKFYRVSTGNLHDVKGFGLGLAYVKRMVTLFNGSITAESVPGAGSTFIITLPLISYDNDQNQNNPKTE